MYFKNLDETDSKILNYLTENGRLSHAELGRLVNLTRAAVRERVHSLLEKKIIERFTIIVDPRKTGTPLSVFFNIEVEWKKLDDIVETLVAFKEITTVYQMSGGPHLHVHAMLDDPEHIERYIVKLRGIDGITLVSSELLLRRFKEKQSILV